VTMIRTAVYRPEDPAFRSCYGSGEPLPYLYACIAAFRDDGAIAGSLCLYDNPHIRYAQAPVMLAGNIHCGHDEDLCYALTSRAEQTAAAAGKSWLMAAMNGSTWEDYRLPLEDSSEGYITDIPQPAMYSRLLLRRGFHIADRYYSDIAPVRMIKTAADACTAVTQAGINICQIDPARMEQELQALYPLCMAAFAGNRYFSPVTEAAFVRKYMQAAAIMDPGFVWIAETAQGRPAAFLFALPDTVMPEQKRIVLKTIARDPACKVKGLIRCMAAGLYSRAAGRGYRHIIHAFMHEGNISKRLSEQFGGKTFRTYALLVKKIPS